MSDPIFHAPFFSLQPQQKIQCSLAMQQSLDILQMPTEELSSWLEQQIEQNPLFDWKDSSPLKAGGLTNIDIAYEPSLFEYLMNQAREQIQDPPSLEQMEWLIGNLEDTGFFTTPFEIAPPHWDAKKLEFLLYQLQQFDPPGIGARNLQESLLLQLKAKGKEKNFSYLLIKDHLENLLQGKLGSIQKTCQIDEKTLQEAIHRDISCLDPFPGIRFQKKTSPSLIPDLFFIEEEESWKIEINEDRLPAYTIRSSLKDFSQLSCEEKILFKQYLEQAKKIHTMIEKRRETLYKVTKHLVKTQIHYLKGESSTLLPISMTEIASALNLHESTIARALNHKYLSCKSGIIPLKSLLSKHLNKTAEHISSDQAQKLLQKLIAEENKEVPLSDQELLEKMQKIGVPCARRTITKYRKLLHIPSRRFRKNASFR
ncbi:MAG: RNA polymerase factor sigma-54 [Verrucomicrobia bacterium]|nr:RNA polymerase factor sigma-54 [Verrucomicrobiota bacterium]